MHFIADLISPIFSDSSITGSLFPTLGSLAAGTRRRRTDNKTFQAVLLSAPSITHGVLCDDTPILAEKRVTKMYASECEAISSELSLLMSSDSSSPYSLTEPPARNAIVSIWYP